MTCPPREESGWHQTTTALLYGLAVAGGLFGFVYALVLLVPAALCTRAGIAWVRGDATAQASMTRAHSTTLAFLTALAFVGMTLLVLSLDGSSDRDRASAVAALVAPVGLTFASWMALRSLPILPCGAGPAEVMRVAGVGIRATLPADRAEPDEDHPLAVVHRVDWHRFVTASLCLLLAFCIPFCDGWLQSVPLQIASTFLMAFLLAPLALCLVASAARSDRLEWMRAAHRTVCLGAGVVIAIACLLAVLFARERQWEWAPPSLGLCCCLVLLLFTGVIVFASGKVLRSLPSPLARPPFRIDP